MNMRTAWMVTLMIAGTTLATPQAFGQVPPGMLPTPYGPMAAPGMPNPYAPPMYGVAPVGYMQGGPVPGGPMPGMMPGGPMPGGPMPGGPMPGGMGGPMPEGPGGGMSGYPYSEEGYTGGYGCDNCGMEGCNGGCRPGSGIIRLISFFLPYDDGGCCAPHWFDVHAEYVNFQREEVSRTQNFMSLTPLGPIVLSTDNLDFDNAGGFRATVTMQVAAGSNLELTYLGQQNWNTSASVSDPGNGLFSVFSGYGSFPLAGQGFTETDQASFASIAYSSSFDNLELNYRQRWQGYGCKLQGSWLAGIRYFQLDEQFIFNTQAPINNGAMNYFVGTSNQLLGFQVGGDIWACVIPGFSIGAEGKVGIYGNRARQHTTIDATTVQPPLVEQVEDKDAAFIGEAGLMANWRVSQSWTFRGGYQFLYVNGVALAPENFNSTPPFLVPAFTNPPRTPTIVSDGDVFYHGFTAGFEYMW